MSPAVVRGGEAVGGTLLRAAHAWSEQRNATCEGGVATGELARSDPHRAWLAHQRFWMPAMKL